MEEAGLAALRWPPSGAESRPMRHAHHLLPWGLALLTVAAVAASVPHGPTTSLHRSAAAPTHRLPGTDVGRRWQPGPTTIPRPRSSQSAPHTDPVLPALRAGHLSSGGSSIASAINSFCGLCLSIGCLIGFLRILPLSMPCTWSVASASATSSDAQSKIPAGTWDLEAFSPSKVNLFLRILRRRPDGYHDLASLFQAINLGDTLRLKLLPDGATEDEFKCNMPGVPLDRTNLVLRAIDLVRAKTGVTRRLRVQLDKKVPAQAGLGGGSGNAATALWAANELFGRPATLSQLIEWSAELGSDITFFLSGGTAYCTGRGEILTPLPPLPPQRLYIFKPSVGLSTAAVFRALDLTTLSPADPERLLEMFQKAMPTVAAAPSSAFVNDLQLPAFQVAPELADLQNELLGYGFPHVFMSGSGSSIVALGEPTGGTTGAAVVAALNGRDGLQAFQADFLWRRGDDAAGNPQWY